MNSVGLFSRVVGLFCFGLTVGCAPQTPSGGSPFASKPEVRADDDISRSFAARPSTPIEKPRLSGRAGNDSGLVSRQNYLEIKRSALEKEFLFQGQLIAQPVVAQGSALRSQVVAFRERGGKIYLIGANAGHTVSQDLPQNFLLAEFPVISQDAQSIVFDFGEGMRKLLGVAGEWGASDLEGAEYNPAAQFATAPASVSYIESVGVSAQDPSVLVIRQIAQLAQVNRGVEVRTPVEVRYFISPYRPNPGFVAKASPGFEKVGFFELAPQLRKDGTTFIPVTRWDAKQQWTYAVSANTPAEFKDAVRDGILYWNQVLGSDQIQVVEAPIGATAPHPDYNIVQWVPWDQAGSAYADAQSDPRTGEIHRAQVYLTSAFGQIAQVRAFQKMRDAAKKHTVRKLGSSQHLPRLVMRGFVNPEQCGFDLNAGLASRLEALSGKGIDLTQARALKIAQDYVREVTAHEIGHTLGLRHNFAGSVATSFAPDARREVFRTYLEKGQTPRGVVLSSTVMDYNAFEEAVMLGDQIGRRTRVGEYDVKALQILYAGKNFGLKEMPAFCTDSHIGVYADCERFDSGRNAFESVRIQQSSAFLNAARSIADFYVAQKAPERGAPELTSEEWLPPSAEGVAEYLLAGREALMSLTQPGATFLSVRREFPALSVANARAFQEANYRYVERELARAGGVKEIFSPLGRTLVQEIQTEFNAWIQDPAFRRGRGLDGQEYQFSDAEIEVIRKSSQLLFNDLLVQLVVQDLKILSRGKIADRADSDDFAELFLERAQSILFEAVEDPIVAVVALDTATSQAFGSDRPAHAPKNKRPVEAPVSRKMSFPRYTYPIELRLLVATLFDREESAEAPEWAYAQKKKLGEFVRGYYKRILGNSELESISLEGVPSPVARWVIESRMLTKAFEAY